MAKKNYSESLIDVITLDSKDIIRTSDPFSEVIPDDDNTEIDY